MTDSSFNKTSKQKQQANIHKSDILIRNTWKRNQEKYDLNDTLYLIKKTKEQNINLK